jgi:hypothetical protein
MFAILHSLAMFGIDFFRSLRRLEAEKPKWRKSLVNAQDALTIGKTPRAVAVTNAKPTAPRTANTAKDTFSKIIPSVCCLSFGLMGCFRAAIAPRRMSYFVCTAFNFNSSTQTGENW